MTLHFDLSFRVIKMNSQLYFAYMVVLWQGFIQVFQVLQVHVGVELRRWWRGSACDDGWMVGCGCGVVGMHGWISEDTYSDERPAGGQCYLGGLRGLPG